MNPSGVLPANDSVEPEINLLSPIHWFVYTRAKNGPLNTLFLANIVRNPTVIVSLAHHKQHFFSSSVHFFLHESIIDNKFIAKPFRSLINEMKIDFLSAK